MEKKIIYASQEQQEKDELFNRRVMFMKAIAWQLDKWLTDIKVRADVSIIRCIECGLDVAEITMKDDLETIVVESFMGKREFTFPLMASDNSKVFNSLLGYLAGLHWRY